MSNRGGGRKEDAVWQYFVKSVTPGKTGCKATCRACGAVMMGLVTRMKTHRIFNCKAVNRSPPSEAIPSSDDNAARLKRVLDELKDVVNPAQSSSSSAQSSSSLLQVQSPTKKQKTSVSIGSYIIKTSPEERNALDLQIARLVYATNSPFTLVEHKEFKKLIEMLRPGYNPPSRLSVGDTLLDQVHDEVYTYCKEKVEGKTVTMELDGWSNIHNEPIVCCSVTTRNGDTFLTSTIDTQDERHTADNLEVIAEKAIKEAEESLGCRVESFVTDNAANMKKMRSQLKESYSIIAYPCSAHIADRLAKDVDSSAVKSDIVAIHKYFRNHHLPNSWYKQAGGKALPIPCEVRWNSVNDCLQAYVNNWATLVKVVETHREEIDSNICNQVLDITLKHKAMEYLSRMKPIAIALDKLQRDKCHLSDAVVIWKELQETFENMPLPDYMNFETRISAALTPAHLLAYILDPRYYGHPHLTREEFKTAINFLRDHNQSAHPSVLKYLAMESPYESYMLSPDILKDVDPLTWWISQKFHLDEHIISLVEQLHTARASTAGIERIFSTFGYVHSKTRNRLNTAKAAKLVFFVQVIKHVRDCLILSCK